MAKDLDIKTQVKLILDLIKSISPGKSVELRVPPYGVIQCVAGGNHRRGTPPNTVEMSGTTLIKLINSPKLWAELVSQGEISASGISSDLSSVFTQAAAKYPPKQAHLAQGGVYWVIFTHDRKDDCEGGQTHGTWPIKSKTHKSCPGS